MDGIWENNCAFSKELMVKKRKKRKILFGCGVFSFLEIFFSCYHIHIYHTACMAVPKIPINRSFFRTRQPTGNDPQPLTTSKGRNTTTNLQPPGKQPPPRINWPKEAMGRQGAWPQGDADCSVRSVFALKWKPKIVSLEHGRWSGHARHYECTITLV